MNIQVIQYEAPTTEEKDMTFSLWQAPRAIDDFDINFIDLSDENMWTAREASLGEIDSKADLATVRQMVDNSRKAKVVFVLPQNVQYTYGTKYTNPCRSMLKDVIGEVQRKIFYAIIPFNSLAHISVVYARTETQIGGNKIGSDFYFDTIYPAVTKSDKSEQTTTIMLNSRIYVTTLDIIQASDRLKLFVSSILEKPQHEGAPEWMNQIQFYDDIIQQNAIRACEKEIEKASKRISDAKIRLEENSRIKSILYTNGNSLVAVVFEILEKLLDCDLSEFVDKKKEDFLIKKSSCTFIGEIKGVTSNVKHEHISQIELHYRGYLDRLDDEGISESVKQLLIIPFRSKPLDQREPVHKEQITLAERNGCLIIETHTLMRMYENYCLGLLTAQRCEEIFAKCTGVLKKSDFDDSQSQG